MVRGNILDPGAPVISRWAPTHGLEAICNWRNLLVGFTIFFLARMNGALYLMNTVSGSDRFLADFRRRAIFNGAVFVVLFLALAAVLFTGDGYAVENGSVVAVRYKYLLNLLDMWWLLIVLLAGVVLVLAGYAVTLMRPSCRQGIWWTGTGTVLTIVALLCDLGYNNTCYMPSLSDPQSSLTIANSSSTEFTLTVMSWVSLVIPFVIAYIWVVWKKMNSRPVTESEADSDHAY